MPKTDNDGATVTFEYVEANLDENGGLEVFIGERESAWNPASTKGPLYGPAQIRYRRFPDGGWHAVVTERGGEVRHEHSRLIPAAGDVVTLKAYESRLVPAYHGKPRPGDVVTLTARGPMGTLVSPRALRFAEETIEQDSEGEYLEQHPTLEGWHIVIFDTPNGKRYCPLADGTFVWRAAS